MFPGLLTRSRHWLFLAILILDIIRAADWLLNESLRGVRTWCSTVLYSSDTALFPVSRLLVPGITTTNPCSVSWHPDMPQIFDSVLSWTTNNNMQINTSKTKEMIFGSLSTANLPLLSISAGSVERVSSFKLLGLNFDASLSWSVHITIILQFMLNAWLHVRVINFCIIIIIIITTTKASKWLYFLKQLKRVEVPPQQRLHL